MRNHVSIASFTPFASEKLTIAEKLAHYRVSCLSIRCAVRLFGSSRRTV